MVRTGDGVGPPVAGGVARCGNVHESKAARVVSERRGCRGFGWSGGRSVRLGGWVVVPAVRAVRYNFTAFSFPTVVKVCTALK